MTPDVYPVNDFGPIMKGLVIGGLGIFHVFTAQFAIGGGMLMCYLQYLSMTGRSNAARIFLDSYFKFLVLLSFVAGALTGVGMWLTSIQVSPRTIGLMVDAFHWVWGIEWSFFCLEVVAGYAFYRYAKHLNDQARLTLLVLYSIGSYASLFWINGILSWQLTPGEWINTQSVWAGFFNAGFWPSLLYRTVAALTVASLVALVVVNVVPGFEREQRTELVQHIAYLLAPMVLMPVLGAWYLFTMPADSRGWAMGGSVAITLFLTIATAASAVIGLYAVLGLLWRRLYINGATALVLVFLAFGATAGGEFVREGVRKPFTVRDTLYSNSIHIREVAELRRHGLTERGDPYPLRDAATYPTDQLRQGALVYRQQCSACHTIAGVNALTELMATWTRDQKRLNIAQLQRTKPFMPPFAGTPAEVEAVVQYIEWEQKKRPRTWAVPQEGLERQALLAKLRAFLDEAGTEPADAHTRAVAWYQRGQRK